MSDTCPAPACNLPARAPTPTTEKAAALAIIQRGLDRGFAVKVYFEDGQPAFDSYTTDLSEIAGALQATSMEIVKFAARPPHDPKWSHRGAVTFIWGNGVDEVAADFTDSPYLREMVEGFINA